MFENFKEKLQSVQENLSTSFRELSGNKVSFQKPKVGHREDLNLNAGTEVLAHFQSNWAELHSQSQDNAKTAQFVDEIIGKFHRRLEIQWRSINQGNTVLSKLPEIIQEVEDLSTKLDGLGDLFAVVEGSLLQLENLIETKNLQERQLDHRFELVLYKEKKMYELQEKQEKMQKDLSLKHQQQEEQQVPIMKERQNAFDVQFKDDLNYYKKHKTVPKIELRGGSSESKLESVVTDEGDNAALEAFLNDGLPEEITEVEAALSRDQTEEATESDPNDGS